MNTIIKATALAATLLWSTAGLSAAQDPQVIEITIKDHKFSPSVVNVPEGKKVVLRVRNLDKTPEEFESHALRREKIIPPGTKADIYIGPLERGEYKFEGEFNANTARGKVLVK